MDTFSQIKKHIVFWLPTYPETLESFLIALAKKEYKITVVVLGRLLKERIDIYNNSDLIKHTNILYWDDKEDIYEFFNRSFVELSADFNIFGGFLGVVGNCLSIYNKHFSGKNAIVLTEKPSVLPYENKYKDFVLRPLKKLYSRYVYRKAYKRNENAISAILVTGKKGVKQLNSYGIKKDILFNFMYTHIDENISETVTIVKDKLKFVYVGRFDLCNRGLDNLMYAFSSLKRDNWTLDLVGGYGKDVDYILDWASKTDGVSFIGSWKSNEVITNMKNYDVCINPTKVDGWRIQVNQAIVAGVSVITTDEAVSDELVESANCGVVVNAFSKRKLLNAIENTLDNIEQVGVWKQNAKKYADKISNEAVAAYFEQILVWLHSKDKSLSDKPVSPW